MKLENGVEMLSKLVVRSVLSAILVGMFWLAGLTWLHTWENIGQMVIILLVEGGVMVAALSLLIESFRSFGAITVSRKSKSLKHVLLGYTAFDKDGSQPFVNVRTCELFALRSVILSFTGLITAVIIFFLYEAGRRIILFLFKPQLPDVNWPLLVGMVAAVIIGSPAVFYLVSGGEWLNKRLADRHWALRIVAIGFYISTIGGIFIGTFLKLFPGPDLGVPLYLIILHSIGVTLMLGLSLGIIFSIGYGLYKIVGVVSQKFPALGRAWNQVCPVQTIYFE